MYKRCCLYNLFFANYKSVVFPFNPIFNSVSCRLNSSKKISDIMLTDDNSNTTSTYPTLKIGLTGSIGNFDLFAYRYSYTKAYISKIQ
jgi:hypothetical protein